MACVERVNKYAGSWADRERERERERYRARCFGLVSYLIISRCITYHERPWFRGESRRARREGYQALEEREREDESVTGGGRDASGTRGARGRRARAKETAPLPTPRQREQGRARAPTRCHGGVRAAAYRDLTTDIDSACCTWLGWMGGVGTRWLPRWRRGLAPFRCSRSASSISRTRYLDILISLARS